MFTTCDMKSKWKEVFQSGVVIVWKFTRSRRRSMKLKTSLSFYFVIYFILAMKYPPYSMEKEENKSPLKFQEWETFESRGQLSSKSILGI